MRASTNSALTLCQRWLIISCRICLLLLLSLSSLCSILRSNSNSCHSLYDVTAFTYNHHNIQQRQQQQQQQHQKLEKIPYRILSLSSTRKQHGLLLSMGLKSFVVGRFRPKREIEDQKQSPIQIGDQLPNIDVEWIHNYVSPTTEDTDSTSTPQIISTPISILDVLGSSSGTKSNSLLIGMPGAFTPTCSKKHLPGYIELASQFQSLCNIKTIGIITTNDRYVNEQWTTQYGLLSSNNTGVDNIIKILSDGDGDFVKSIGLADDMGFGIGIRSKRFALLLDENCKVTKVYTEGDDTGLDDCTQTSAYSIFNDLKPNPVKDINDNNNESLSINPILILGSVMAIGFAVLISSFTGGNTGSSSSTTSPASSSPIIRNEPTPKTKTSSSKEDNKFPLLKEYNSEK